MKLKGFSFIEVLVSIFLWTSFLYVFQSYEFQNISNQHVTQKEMAHTFIIENVLSLYHLGLIPVSNIFYMNTFGYIASDGIYEIHQNDNQIKIDVEGETIYVFQKP